MRDRKPQRDMLEWLGIRKTPNWQVARAIGPVISMFIALLIAGAYFAAFAIVYGVLFGGGAASLGTGALIAALLGAPFVIWGTVLRHQTLRYQKEGHITDRITAAVEQLGVEKTISYVARNISHPAVPPEEREGCDNEHVDRLQRINAKTDSVIRTIDPEFKYGRWSVFTETVPNIEVRIGAILSLERIAQDSTINDKGRDHVRVMEILCAYVRENAPASEASAFPFPQEYKQESLEAKRTPPWAAITNEFKLRSDVQLALSVIGRRTPEQMNIEANHPMNSGNGYRLDLSHTNLRYADLEYKNFSNASFFRSQMQVAFCRGADLSGSNFRYTQLTAAQAQKANLSKANLELADLSHAELTDAVLSDCTMSDTHFVRTNLKGAELWFCKNKNNEMRRAFFMESDLKGALMGGDLLGVAFSLRVRPDESIPRNIYGVGFRECRIAGTRRIFGDIHHESAIPAEWLGKKTFGDASVILPEGMDRPAHWPDWEMPLDGPHAFHPEWRKWQADPERYVPPPSPVD